jgi:oxygen-dependent protoporphyrinogen oxidase
VTLAYLGWPAAALPRPLDAYGFLVPPAEPLRLLGAVYCSAIHAGRAPQGEALIAARVGGARRPADAALPDAEIVALVREELRALLGISAPPHFVHLVRHERALPQYTLGHAARVRAVQAAEARTPGLYFATNALHGLGVADCVARSARVAAQIASS